MSILTNTDIKNIICTESKDWDQNSQLLILNYDEQYLTPMGYDLRVGGFYKTFLGKPNLSTLKEGDKLMIKPKDIALVSTLEQIKMPQDGSISAIILSKVSKVAKGLSHISTKVDPGWDEGSLLIPLQNILSEELALDYGESFCTIIFFRNESPPTSLYSSDNGREKLVKLLAQVRKSSTSYDFILYFISVIIAATSTIALIYIYSLVFQVENQTPTAVIGGSLTFSIFLAKQVEEFLKSRRARQ